tara:strand:- start:155 stop:736 length:582 start_codon:yes stop_codon:yes gene_type:complete
MSIKNRVEAILLASNRPLSQKDLLELMNIDSNEGESQLMSAIYELQQDYESRAMNLIQVSSGYRIQINNIHSDDVAKLWEAKPLRLSKATLETLSIIVYMQPVTRGDIEDIRGVSVATSVIKLLIDQGWIKIKGYRDVPGRPALFVSTDKFLDDFSLKSLSDLPSLPDLPELQNITPELTLQDEDQEQPAQEV